ncbi:hypothetical protein [Terribacillus aidingensis]|uniref:hypothetical protein n=1 Tax=Terribacillus aidingensis TaxID=586416 RepID=UPI000BE394CA|nr:hypothetical protein [Terribacillus aidingensis]
MLEKANAEINQHPAIHARVSVYTEDESYDTFHSMLLDYEYDLFAEKYVYQKQLRMSKHFLLIIVGKLSEEGKLLKTNFWKYGKRV